MKFLITGGCGFLGSNLATEVIKRGEELVIVDNLYRLGSEKNLEWLKTLGNCKFYRSDVRIFDDMNYIMKEEKPDVVFHVAGQVAMTTSMQRPRLDFDINVLGTHNILESIREHCPNTKVFFSSTNKVYGDLENLEYAETDSRYTVPSYPNGLPETISLDFRTPYGCSKGAADQYMLDYYKSFGIETVVFRHSSIFGGRQFSTFDQGWIGWFVQQALDTKKGSLQAPFTISGTGKQVRDVLFSEDLISCYFSALENINKTKGMVFNIGGGASNSLSLLELFSFLESELSIKLEYKRLPPRESDQKSFIADITKAEKVFGWSPKIDKEVGLRRMIDWVASL
tara:strand:- start:2526 stop:3545 length:1020 start_codon:yes stop_codon:yes gene_type:complete